MHFVFQDTAWCWKGAIFKSFSASFENLLVVVSSGGDDAGVCCKVVVELFVDFIWVFVLDVATMDTCRWCRREKLSSCFQGVLSFHVVSCGIDFIPV